MSLKFASLGSGSQGNALLVRSASATLLVDCGFSLTEVERRLARFDISGTDINAVLVTHEHGDHVGGVSVLANRYSLPVYCTPGTYHAASSLHGLTTIKMIHGYQPFHIEDIKIEPFPVPHDAREPSQFVISRGKNKLGILTDCGSSTEHLLEKLTGCSSLFIEFNHDEKLLAKSVYPKSLKDRISGPFGHLSNGEAMDVLKRVRTESLQNVVAAHLSEKNNNDGLVKDLLMTNLDGYTYRVLVASQSKGTAWICSA